MAEYYIKEISKDNEHFLRLIDDLLIKEGIKRDKNLDLICGVFDDNNNIIATGSAFGNTLRCFAVHKDHQGEGLVNMLLTHLISALSEKGYSHLFLYTKTSTSPFFKDLGFSEIAVVENSLVFMENRSNGFRRYLSRLEQFKKDNGKSGAIVMNANPFTLGHQYLVEKAASNCDTLHLFIVSEDTSLIPFTVRKNLVIEGTKHIKNIIYHNSGPYIISSATFPSYFLKDDEAVSRTHAMLDLKIFCKIAKTLNISVRFVGDEPFSKVTALYNEIMSKSLPENGIDCIIIKRKALENKNSALGVSEDIISASKARYALQKNDLELFSKLVPKTTYDFFTSDASKEIIAKIQEAENVIHH